MTHEPYHRRTFLEHFYARQCKFHTGRKAKSLPQALALLTHNKIVSFDVAKKVLDQHAKEETGKELNNPFARIHEFMTKTRRKKKFDELMLQYGNQLALTNPQ